MRRERHSESMNVRESLTHNSFLRETTLQGSDTASVGCRYVHMLVTYVSMERKAVFLRDSYDFSAFNG